MKLERIGATILGVKPAELLNIPLDQGKDENSFWRQCKLCLVQYPEVRFRFIKKQKNRHLVLFYHRAALDQHLQKKGHLRLLRSFGYPEDYTLDCYLEHLANKFLENDLPHEVGIFLGYPLKDVLGYIGHPSLKLSKIKGWNYYGDVSLSEIKYENYRSARNEVRKMIGTTSLFD